MHGPGCRRPASPPATRTPTVRGGGNRVRGTEGAREDGRKGGIGRERGIEREEVEVGEGGGGGGNLRTAVCSDDSAISALQTAARQLARLLLLWARRKLLQSQYQIGITAPLVAARAQRGGSGRHAAQRNLGALLHRRGPNAIMVHDSQNSKRKNVLNGSSGTSGRRRRNGYIYTPTM